MSRRSAIITVDQHSSLNAGQKAVIEDVLSSPDRIQGIQGVAGAGKTTTLETIRSAAEAKGYQVEGFAPTSRAAKQLEHAGVRAGTLQGFLARGGNNETELQPKRLFFIDESSLASTSHLREFLQRMGSGDRVLLIGDTRQHQGVEAGRPFQQLQEAGMKTAKLEEVVRQKDAALKATAGLVGEDFEVQMAVGTCRLVRLPCAIRTRFHDVNGAPFFVRKNFGLSSKSPTTRK